MTVEQFFKDVERQLSDVLGSASEGKSAARLIFEDVAGYDVKFIFMNGSREMLPETAARISAVVSKIKGGMPVQYAVGKALFMGNYYSVNPSTLIPRPETAGLVDLITDRWSNCRDLSVLDIGTGSGCIAISLAKTLPFAQVSACDISNSALDMARQNAKELHADVRFFHCDILCAPLMTEPAYDIIVSNPPYICQSEEAGMDTRVSKEEPVTALFVLDNDPLKFYKAIGEYACGALKPDGMLYFEINSRFPEEMRRLLESQGFDDVQVLRDYCGNYRYATATKRS